MLAEVKRIMAEVWQVDGASIPDNASLNHFEPWDSLGHVSLLLAIEAEYGLTVDMDAIQNLRTIDAIVLALQHREQVAARRN